MLTIELDDPGSYGRVVRDDGGEVERVVEAKAAGDADPGAAGDPRDQRRHLRLRRGPLAAALGAISNDNAQGEYYLTDVFPALREAGHAVAAHLADDIAVTMGVNNRRRPRRGRGRGPPPHPRGPHAGRRHRRRPRLDLDRRRRRDRRRRPDRARHQPAGRAPRSAPARSSAR